MTNCITNLEEILSEFDIMAVDQWGVLHQGGGAFASAITALEALLGVKPAVVLSNSGKRAASNSTRISQMGFDEKLISQVVTSGEVAWQTLHEQGQTLRFVATESRAGDAEQWAGESELISITGTGDDWDKLLIMGIPENTPPESFDPLLRQALELGRPAICTNPDILAPRPGGKVVPGPGSIAARFEKMGGTVDWYGKPHRRVYDAVAKLYPDCPRARLLMVGDSLTHDIAGAHAAGFASVLVTGGIHAAHFADRPVLEVLDELCAQLQAPAPDYVMAALA